jgi:hypothetical protein
VSIRPDEIRVLGLQPIAAFPGLVEAALRYVDDFPVEKSLELFVERFPNYGEKLPDGWSWSSWLLCVGPDDQLFTFTGPYGAWKTLKNVVSQYLIKVGQSLPTCTFSTRPRGDDYNNIDPVFNVMADCWKDARVFAQSFPGLIAMPQLGLAAPEAKKQLSAPVPKPVSEPAGPRPFAPVGAIDDDIPFMMEWR